MGGKLKKNTVFLCLTFPGSTKVQQITATWSPAFVRGSPLSSDPCLHLKHHAVVAEASVIWPRGCPRWVLQRLVRFLKIVFNSGCGDDMVTWWWHVYECGLPHQCTSLPIHPLHHCRRLQSISGSDSVEPFFLLHFVSSRAKNVTLRCCASWSFISTMHSSIFMCSLEEKCSIRGCFSVLIVLEAETAFSV